MAESTTMTIRVPPELNEWQINELQAAVGEADAGDFASEEEVGAVMNKWSATGSANGGNL